MAFVRAWAEGLDLVVAWNRFLYVDGVADARRARSELQRLLDQLRGLALAHGRPELAALLRRDPEAMPEAGPKIPTLEEFAARQPADYYSEAELIALHQAEYGQADARSTARRRQRLRERLIGTVLWLERLEARAPQPGDATQAWLDARVAQRLSAAGIHTLGELIAWIGGRGFRWYRGIPRLGPQGAARLVRWLRDHQPSLGALPSPALLPRSRIDTRALTPAPGAGIAPLERFRPPADRDGSRGSNRAPRDRCQLQAAGDWEAVQAWLGRHETGSHTWRAYRKEAERFLLWAVVARGKALSSLDGADCLAYRDFLAAPASGWTAPRGTQRWSAQWRPFEGPLSALSQRSALSVASHLCAWLVRQHYLATNPWEPGAGRASPAPPAQRTRPSQAPQPPRPALSPAQWARVQAWLGAELARAPSPALHRLRVVLTLATLAGLRLPELAEARLGWLRRTPGEGGAGHWSIQVPAAGRISRELPLPAVAVEALQAYLAARGLAGEVLARLPEAPLIARLDQETSLGRARLHDVLVTGLGRCAEAVRALDPPAAQCIQAATARWLRHSYGLQSAAHGMPQQVLQARLGHATPAAAGLYRRAGGSASDPPSGPTSGLASSVISG